jgi:uncharacterized membrane protein YgcG
MVAQVLDLVASLLRQHNLDGFESRCHHALHLVRAHLVAVGSHRGQADDVDAAVDMQQLAVVLMHVLHDTGSVEGVSGCARYLAYNVCIALFDRVGDLLRLSVSPDLPELSRMLMSVHVWLLYLTTREVMLALEQQAQHSTTVKLCTATASLLNALQTRAQPCNDSHLGLMVTKLPERTELAGWTLLADVLSHSEAPPPSDDMLQTRLNMLLRLGREVCQQLPLCFKYSPKTRVFLAKQSDKTPTASTTRTVTATNGMMTAMAQLRLEAQVASLQTQLEATADVVVTSPYLIPDTAAFAANLFLLKELVDSSKFIIIVTDAVLMGLDLLKKGTERLNRGAREATRYLETTLRKGHVGVRMQQPFERVDSLQMVASGMTHEMVGLLGCLRYYALQVCQDANMVTLLTADPLLLETAHSEQLQAVATGTFHRQAKQELAGRGSSAASRGRGRGHGRGSGSGRGQSGSSSGKRGRGGGRMSPMQREGTDSLQGRRQKNRTKPSSGHDGGGQQREAVSQRHEAAPVRTDSTRARPSNGRSLFTP